MGSRRLTFEKLFSSFLFSVFLFFAMAAGFSVNAAESKESNCDDLPEAKVCSAPRPWKKVTDFPWGNYSQDPKGEVVIFHLDGRGGGLIQRLELPYFESATKLADWWVFMLSIRYREGESDLLFDKEGWDNFEVAVRNQRYVGRKTRVNNQGLAGVARISFVQTEAGQLIITSIVNEKMNSQAGEYLHNGLLKSISLKD